MYYKLCDDVLFRKYKDVGYLTDNLEFGYHMLNSSRQFHNEKYVSESGAIMLNELCRAPKSIETIVSSLMDIFVGVDYNTLKADTEEFYQGFVKEGFLLSGDDIDSCNNSIVHIHTNDSINKVVAIESTENCTKNLFDPKDLLKSIHIEIASECNERCIHCYIPHEEKNKVISKDLLFKILEQGRKLNIINVILSGGEPLLHKDIISFLRKCKELDLSVNVLTNLTLLTNDILEEMKHNPLLSIQTSLYSINPAIHDQITLREGSCEKTKNGILKLISEGIPVQISCPIMKQNSDSFYEVIQWGLDHNIGVVTEPVIFASYDHTKSNLVNRLEIDEISHVVDTLMPNGYAEMMRQQALEKEAQKEDYPICSICRFNFCVSAEGNVFPCVGWQTNIIGDLNSQAVSDIWESSPDVKRFRSIKRSSFPKCVNCNDRGYCTVCMMSNSNENTDGDAYRIDDYHCKVAALIHEKVDEYYRNVSK